MSTKLDIYSDPICPWCYIGKARLERALQLRPDHPFVITWHPFMLNPGMPAQGMDRREYLQAKFGAPDDVLKAYLPVQQAADQDGLPIELSKITRTPSTLDAHRLIHWAGLEERQNAVVNALFHAYFIEGQDISKPEVLETIAEACGMDRAMTTRLLATDADTQDIRTRDAEIRDRGLQGVPGFLIGRTYVVSGAHPTDFWVQVIDDLAKAVK